MRLVVVLMLVLAAFTVTVVASPPIGWTEEGLTNMLRDILNREPTTQDIENAKIHEFTVLSTVDLSTLDNDGSSGQVDTPRERRRTAEDFDDAFGE